MSASHSGGFRAARPVYAPVFAALGDETRLGLVMKLSHGRPQSISELTAGSALTRQAVSKHLRVLENVGLVEAVRVGRESRYQFQPQRLKDVTDYLEDVSRQWDDALGRLESFLER